jgi:hypothetical protein
MMILDHHQVGRDALRLADDGFRWRVIPVGGDVDVDVVLADARRQLLELLAPRSLHLAFHRAEIDAAPLQRLRIQRRCDVMEQRELRVQSLRDLRGLVHRGQRARLGILDGNQYSPDGLHPRSVAEPGAALHR